MTLSQNSSPASTPDFDARKIAESILGEGDWRDSFSAFFRCPGEHLHSHRTGKRDCQLLLDGPPTLYCFHTSCAGVVDQINYKLRSEIGRAERGGFVCDWKPSPADIARRAEKERVEKLKCASQVSVTLTCATLCTRGLPSASFVMNPEYWYSWTIRLLCSTSHLACFAHVQFCGKNTSSIVGK
jgi:hypothetical protein